MLTSLVAAAILGQTPPAQIKPVLPLRTSVIYNVTPEPANAPWVQSDGGCMQFFIMTSSEITSIQLPIQGTGQVVCDIFDSAQKYRGAKEQTIAASGNTVFTFSPPIKGTIGEELRFRVTRKTAGSLKFRMADELSYPWDNPRNPYDSNFKDVYGTVHGAASLLSLQQPTKPSKRALIVFLENGGVSLKSVPGLATLPFPSVRFAKCGSLEFKMKDGESVADMIARLVKEGINLAANMMNPSNWSIRQMTFEEWFKPTSDMMIEQVVKGIQLAQNGSTRYKYDKVVKLEDSTANAASLLNAVRALTPTYQIDIHVLAHGSRGWFVGSNSQTVEMINFFKPLYQLQVKGGTGRPWLRGIYQMNCVGGTLVPYWQALGCNVVNGTDRFYNNWMPPQYFHFMQNWLNGDSFAVANTKGYDAAKVYMGPIYISRPSYVTESQLLVHGNGNLKVNSL